MPTMRAAVLEAVGQPLRLTELPRPEPGPGEVRVRVDACGVCGSDVFLQDGGFALQHDGRSRLPVVPGHEAAGVVDKLGPGVEGPPPGTQVALYYVDPAPDGAYARARQEHLDPAITRMGVDVDGAFAEYVVRPAHTLIVPPAELDPAALAVLTDAVATPYHALRRACVREGETVVVLGVGGIGANAVQLAAHMGARVIAVSRQRGRLELARRLGAEEVVAGGDGAVAAVRELTGGGADVVVQCAGSAALDAAAVEMAGIGGRAVFVGVSRERFGVLAAELVWRELSLLGSCRFTRDDIRDVIGLHARGAITVAHLLERVRPLDEVNQALADVRSGEVLRSVLTPRAAGERSSGAR
jgi:alcohol dehydrogenase, propanol-preferring